jgi:2'-5' RNA ligase
MRTFIGIELDDGVRNAIKTVQAIVRRNSIRGRFKYVGNFHITVKFLGEIAMEDILEIDEVLQKAAVENYVFDLSIGDLGFFGKEENIRVLWLGLGNGFHNLKSLYNFIEEGLVDKGFKKDNRTYTPHITVAQDLILSRNFIELKKDIRLDIIPDIKVKKISLIKSEQIKGNRIYTPVSTFKLKEYNGTGQQNIN